MSYKISSILPCDCTLRNHALQLAGLINALHLDDSIDVQAGLQLDSQLLIDINALGFPCGTESLDHITPQYLQDCMYWSAIGARTTESQTHREMPSGLSIPV